MRRIALVIAALALALAGLTAPAYAGTASPGGTPPQSGSGTTMVYNLAGNRTTYITWGNNSNTQIYTLYTGQRTGNTVYSVKSPVFCIDWYVWNGYAWSYQWIRTGPGAIRTFGANAYGTYGAQTNVC